MFPKPFLRIDAMWDVIAVANAKPVNGKPTGAAGMCFGFFQEISEIASSALLVLAVESPGTSTSIVMALPI